MGGGLESRCVGRVCGADGAVRKMHGQKTPKTEWFAQISITLQTRSNKMYVTLIKTSSIQKIERCSNLDSFMLSRCRHSSKVLQNLLQKQCIYEDILVSVNYLSVITEVRNVP